MIVLSVTKVGREWVTTPPTAAAAGIAPGIPTGTLITSPVEMFIVWGVICTVGPEKELSTKLPKVAELLVLAQVLTTVEFALSTMTGGGTAPTMFNPDVCTATTGLFVT